MGLYDTLRCHYPLPVAGANEREFQTKSTPAQFFDAYEIRVDGTLWYQAYDQEDRSDPQATGFGRLAGIATRVNQRWVPEVMTGDLRFYTYIDGAWVEFLAEMVSGHMVALTPKSPAGPRQLVTLLPPRDVAHEGDTAGRVLHCLIEFDHSRDEYLGRVVGFPHIEISGPSADDVEAKLRQTVISMAASGSLVQETHYVRLVTVPVLVEATCQIDAVVFALIPEFEQVKVRDSDGRIYALTRATRGIDLGSLHEGQRVRCLVTNTLSKVLSAEAVEGPLDL